MSSSTALSSAIGPATETLRRTLVSGSPLRAIGVLYAVASLTVVPLTYYRTAYSFSVGYGLSVAAMSLALISSFGGFSQLKSLSAPSVLAMTSVAYGLRLAAYIFVRELKVESKRKAFDEMDKKTTALRRTPLALGVSLLYAFMVSPILFAFRGILDAGSVSERVQAFFTGVAAFGMILESVADQHKYEAKRRSREGDDKFVGPTTWSYTWCRHPNYLGEILYWVGLFGAGSVSFGKSIAAWVCGVLGLWGILKIMLGSSSSLDTKQSEKYGGQPAFDEWKGKVTSSVIPFLR
eukprot:CAMPEP_0172551052 /NCGR_PEP_ID=MMETSP1067-20121228/35649_1 /TAXON_ID=265564 ORGANISM="Thalassiosira punctigera, Strain Tpunct2005C2" /NCGR_SAMPLE_ID=MMETSP1067 /ASSEMBLY_ACC=CAM_ASM_000444 /LENGTH=292 /DNA_ID=CAMNT_0013338771 /DNA_START=181 /DNA_END=1059 /DNA_ORIENTATION=+